MRKPSCYSLFWAAALLVLAIGSCVPPVQYEGIVNDISDPVIRNIRDLQDRQSTDSLITYFRHENPSYRYVAAMAFASVQDSTALDSLAILLDDPFEKVRIAAVFSIGQLGINRAEPLLTAAFQQKDTLMQSAAFNAAILEAIGKCGSDKSLRALSTISTYLPSDTLLLEGQSWGIYRFALRGMILSEGTRLMVRYASDGQMPGTVRMIAANYLHRAANINIDTAGVQALHTAWKGTPDPRIRLGIATALGKSRQSAALQSLLYHLSGEPDYRVRCNIIKALGNFDYAQVQATLIQALSDKQPHVSMTAARQFLAQGQPYDGTFYLQKARDSLLGSEVRTLMAGAALKYLPYGQAKEQLNAELIARYRAIADPYEKARLLEALGEWGWNYAWIQQEGFNSGAPVVKSTAVRILAQIAGSPQFYPTFRARAAAVRSEMAHYLVQAARSGDVGMMAEAAVALRDPALQFKSLVRDSALVLLAAQQKLRLPEAIETWNEMQLTINDYLGRQDPLKKTAYNHSIDWGVLVGVTDQTKAVIGTSKGDIELELYPSIAPGSVANFIRLAKSGFFNKKYIHRVVTNHVIQSGCPRGDGYGSLDYSIRSEFSPLYYDAGGYIGMASAGRHTEQTQWFITHVPTPHLDGKYTIFGRVVKGMDIVDALQVGDTVESVAVR